MERPGAHGSCGTRLLRGATMRRTGKCPTLLPAVCTFVALSVLGCAEQRQNVAASAGPGSHEAAVSLPAQDRAAGQPESPSEALQTLDEASRAYESKQYEHSRDLFSTVLRDPQGLTEDQLARARVGLARTQSILHQRKLEARRKAAEAALAEPGVSVPPEAGLARKQALGLLIVVRRLVGDGQASQAVPSLEALDGLREQLSLEERAQCELLRQETQRATGQLPPLSPAEQAARATEQFGAGVAAYERKDYAAASLHLAAAASFGVSLGWWDDRTLRGLREEVDETLARLRAELAEARARRERHDYDGAQEALAAISESGVNIGQPDAGEVDALLAQVLRQREEWRQQELEALKARAAQLLAEAGDALARQDYDAAAAALTELTAKQEDLEAAQREQLQALRLEVEKATGILPGMTPDERLAKAEQYFELGLDAYDGDRFGEAKHYLDLVAKLDVDLGWWDNRTLRKARQRVDETLGRLRAQYERGRQLFEAGQYAAAVEALQAVKDSGINIGGRETEEVDRLIATALLLLDEQESRRVEGVRSRAAEVIAEAAELARGGKHAEALAVLAELTELEPDLSPPQKAQADDLRTAAREGARAAEAQASPGEAMELDAQAGALLDAERVVPPAIATADEAIERGDLEAARTLLTQAQVVLQGLDVSGSAALREAPAQIEEKLAAIGQGMEARGQAAAIRRQLVGMFDESRALMETDLPAAEAKVKEAVALAEQHGVALGPQEVEARNAVLAAVEARYGEERRLGRRQYEQLLDLGDRYREAAEFANARRVLLLVTNAPAELFSEESRGAALATLAALEPELARQEGVAEHLVALFDQHRAELVRGELHKALSGLDAILGIARTERLTGGGLAAVLREAESFLTGEFDSALEAHCPQLAQLINRELSRGRLTMAQGLARLYLSKGSPDLAEPYLKRLASAEDAPAESAAWAGACLRRLEAFRAQADQARLLAVSAQEKEVLEAARRLHEATGAGRMDEAKALERDLDEARADLQIVRARDAVARDSYDEAARLLDEMPRGAASGAAREGECRALLDEVARRRAAAAQLDAVENALEGGNLAEAAAQLAGARQAAALSDPLAVRVQGLADVVNSIMQARDLEAALRAEREHRLKVVRSWLSEVRARAQAWPQYWEALQSVLAGRAEGRAALLRLAAQPVGLRDFEVDWAREEAEAPTGPASELPAEVGRELREADAAYRSGDCVRAAALLQQFREEQGAALAGPLRRAADELAGLIEAREREAREVYEQAVEAYRAGDTRRTTELIERLKADYGGTKAYRDHM